MSYPGSQFAMAVRAIAEKALLLQGTHPTEEEIKDYRAGKLSAQKKEFVEEHLVLCRACADLVLETPEANREQSPGKDQEPPSMDASDLETMIKQVRKSDLSFADELADRLEVLVNVAQEEQPEGLVISADSLRSFVRFLQTETALKQPAVFLTPSGNFRAKWREASNRHLGIEFLSSDDVRFVVFAPDPVHPERTARNSGIMSSEALLQALRPYNVSMWVSRDEG